MLDEPELPSRSLPVVHGQLPHQLGTLCTRFVDAPAWVVPVRATYGHPTRHWRGVMTDGNTATSVDLA